MPIEAAVAPANAKRPDTEIIEGINRQPDSIGVLESPTEVKKLIAYSNASYQSLMRSKEINAITQIARDTIIVNIKIIV